MCGWGWYVHCTWYIEIYHNAKCTAKYPRLEVITQQSPWNVSLVQVEDGKACNGLVGGAQLVSPCLRLPEVLELLHHANQVSPVFATEAVVGTCGYRNQHLSS